MFFGMVFPIRVDLNSGEKKLEPSESFVKIPKWIQKKNMYNIEGTPSRRTNLEMATLIVVETGLERSPIMNQSLQIHRIPIQETVNRPTHLDEEAKPSATPVANNDFKAEEDKGGYNSYFLKAKAVAAMKKNSGESNRMYLEMVT